MRKAPLIIVGVVAVLLVASCTLAAALCRQPADLPQRIAPPQLSARDVLPRGELPHLSVLSHATPLLGAGRRPLRGVYVAQGNALALPSPRPTRVSSHGHSQRFSDRPDAAYTTIPPPLSVSTARCS
jgi:hypothetical protein